MSFVTIIQKNTNNPHLYHGELVYKGEGNFEVCIKTQQGTHEIWTCHYDFWNLVE